MPSSVSSRHLRRGIRRILKPPPEVLMTHYGLPDPRGYVNDGPGVLRAIRKQMAALGMTSVELLGGWPRKVVATGSRAEEGLEKDEATKPRVARGRGMKTAELLIALWARDVHWSRPDGTHILCVGDPEGYDLLFVAWGQGAQQALERVEETIDDFRNPLDGPEPATAQE